MCKEDFRQKLLSRRQSHFDRDKYEKMIKERRGDNIVDLIWCIEEFSELSQALSKAARGKTDIINIYEEVADSLISIGYIKNIFELSDDLIVSAMDIKIDKEDKRNNGE